MWLFIDSENDSGLQSIKAIADSKRELMIEIAKYTLEKDVTTEYFQIGQIKNNEITEEKA